MAGGQVLTRRNYTSFPLHPTFETQMQIGQISREMAAAGSAAMADVDVDPSFVNVIPHDYQDAAQLIANAVWQNNGNMEFFNSTQLNHRTNWAGPQGLENNVMFIAEAFRVDVRFGLLTTSTTAEDLDAQTEPASATSGTSAALRTGIYDFLIKRGLVNLKLQNQVFIDNIRGLDNFPSGRGVTGYGNLNATTAGMSLPSNGIASRENAWRFTPWKIIGPNQRLNCSIAMPVAASLGVTGADVYVTVSLSGRKLTLPQ